MICCENKKKTLKEINLKIRLIIISIMTIVFGCKNFVKLKKNELIRKNLFN